MKYNTEFKINLRPHGASSPQIRYSVNDDLSEINLILTKPMQICVNLDLSIGSNIFTLDFYNKTNETPDMAVEIESVTVEGMTLDRFKWNSRYYPNYPEPWASEQTEILPEFQISATYLGWNGKWKFYFDVPIFMWIHKLENLGWIYS